MHIKQWIILLFSCVLSACATQESDDSAALVEDNSGRPDCIFKSSIRGYEVLDESNLVVSSGASRKYHLTLQRRAHGLRSSWSIGFDSATGSVCAGFDEVVFKGNFDTESRRIASIRRLDEDGYDDLLYRFGKKEPELGQTPAPAEVEGAEVEELDPAATDASSSG